MLRDLLVYIQIVNRAKATRNLDFKKLIDLNLIEKLGKGKQPIINLNKTFQSFEITFSLIHFLKFFYTYYA